MRTLHLYELEWCDKKQAVERNTVWGAGNVVGYKVLAKSARPASNSDIRNLYNYLRKNGNRPVMTETPAGDIRIQYFKKRED